MHLWLTLQGDANRLDGHCPSIEGEKRVFLEMTTLSAFTKELPKDTASFGSLISALLGKPT